MEKESRVRLLESVAHSIQDYRQGEIASPTEEHIERWINQFPREVQELMLNELYHVFKQTYVTKVEVLKFLTMLLTHEKLTDGNAELFWKNVNFLNIQQGGHSQKDFLLELEQLLLSHFGLTINECGSDGGVYVYIDDFLFTGRRLYHDLSLWIREAAPNNAVVHIILIGFHTYGKYYAKRELNKAIQNVKKKVDIHWWRVLELENHISNSANSDVLWVKSLPDDNLAKEYDKMLRDSGYPPIYRSGINASKLFSCEEGRNLLEQQFLLAGLKIRSFCTDPSEIMRPLGFHPLKTLGFGAMVFTYRNCPNNCPLAFWWGNPSADPTHPFSKWFPLFPRKTYDDDICYPEVDSIPLS